MNSTFAGMQRTHYPKHVNYFGDGSGRDSHIITANGGLNSIDKVGMGHTGTHYPRYNNNNGRSRSPSPYKTPTTFYYQADGTGRDSYVL